VVVLVQTPTTPYWLCTDGNNRPAAIHYRQSTRVHLGNAENYIHCSIAAQGECRPGTSRREEKQEKKRRNEREALKEREKKDYHRNERRYTLFV
jgi:hypothetical protein